MFMLRVAVTQRKLLLYINMGWSKITVFLLEHNLFTQHFHLPISGLWSPLFLLFTHNCDSPLDLHITALSGGILCCCPLHTGPLENPPLESHLNPFRVLFLSWVDMGSDALLRRRGTSSHPVTNIQIARWTEVKINPQEQGLYLPALSSLISWALSGHILRIAQDLRREWQETH